MARPAPDPAAAQASAPAAPVTTNDADRFKLLFGPYQAPRFRGGQVLRCEVRGGVRGVSIFGGQGGTSPDAVVALIPGPPECVEGVSPGTC